MSALLLFSKSIARIILLEKCTMLSNTYLSALSSPLLPFPGEAVGQIVEQALRSAQLSAMSWRSISLVDFFAWYAIMSEMWGCSQIGNITEMRIVRRSILDKFKRKCRDRRVVDWLDSWEADMKKATCRTPLELMDRFTKARCIADNRVIFDILGNQYRMVLKINYQMQLVGVRFVGTHAEYDRIDALEV